MAKTVLLVEDNPITRKMVRFAVERQGLEIVDTADAAGALRAFASQPIALVLQDLVLPDMDGFQLLARLRALPGGRDVPIVAFSGLISKLEESRLSSAGFDDVISKPVEPSHLMQIIRAHLPAEGLAADRFGDGKRVIVADDDSVQRKLACFRLERLGFEVLGAADGSDALDKARDWIPDAIVSDVLMPKLDGFGLCVAVRQDPRLAAIPIVLMTNSYMETQDHQLARKAGANDMVFRTPELREVVQALRASLSATAPRAERAGPPQPDIEREHVRRAMSQLERQVALNAGMAQRCALLSAELSVLSGISEALARQANTDDALREVFAGCLDAGGISIGALYLANTGQGSRVFSFGTSGKWTDDEISSLFGDRPLLETVTDGPTLLVLPSEAAGERGDRLLERLGAGSALIASLRHRDTNLGALLMAFPNDELKSEDRMAFAYAVAGQISQALAVAKAFAEQESSEHAARRQAAILRSILESLAEGVIVSDDRGQYIHWNPAAEAILRMGPLHARSGLESRLEVFLGDETTAAPPDSLPMLRAIRGESVDRVELFVRHERAPDGFWLSMSARPLGEEAGIHGGVTVFRDVTAEKATQAQLMVSDRMASIGMLAAGVAHEINNPLATVVANLELAERDLAELEPKLGNAVDFANFRDSLRDAREGAARVTQIVRDLKIFSRSEDERRGPVDVRQVLDSSIRMAWNELRHRARVVKDYGDVPLVNANESRLGQVFLNLVVNAAQALPDGQADRNEIRASTRVDAAGRVQIDIADTGPGIPPEVLKRLFTPFFTTKPTGIGTGLGLAICQRIISALGGAIVIDTAVGKGTVFHVTLPPMSGPVLLNLPASPPQSVEPAKRRGRILVIDDEVAVAKVVKRVLGREHDVIAFSNAVPALAAITGGQRFDVILCDLMMPVMTGVEFHEELSRVAPDQAAKVIFLTGGAFTPTARAFLDQVPNLRIEKPFDLRNLRAVVNERAGV